MHTPGPWRISDLQRNIVVAGKHSNSVATCYIVGITDTMETAEANARLIAAAPDMLEALRGFLTIGYYPETRAAAEAAIAKAEGR